MSTGAVTPTGDATIRLTIHGSGALPRELEAVIDTGYNGELTLPRATVATLGLTWRRRGRATLVDGSSTAFDVYTAQVMWDGALRLVVVDEADTDPLVGMRL